MNRLLSIISLSKKAGKLLAGNDRVKEAVLRGQAHVVLTASDLSEKSRRGIEALCKAEKVPSLAVPVTMEELAWEIGKRTGILAVTEPGLAGKLQSMAGRKTET